MRLHVLGGALEAFGVLEEERASAQLRWTRVKIERLYFPLMPHLNLLSSHDFHAILRAGVACYELPVGHYVLLSAKYDPPWKVPYFARDVILGIATAADTPLSYRALYEEMLRS